MKKYKARAECLGQFYMAAVIAEGGTSSSWYDRVRPEVDISDARTVIIFHSSHVELSERDAGAILLGLRRKWLMYHIHASLRRRDTDIRPRDTSKCVAYAFERMNMLLEACPSSRCLRNDFLWRSQYNSLVVIVENGRVYVFGDARARVVLSRNGRDVKLTNESVFLEVGQHRYDHEITGESVLDERLCFANTATLTPDDKYLVVATPHVWGHIGPSHITPVLETRIDALGLEKACEEIAGFYVDSAKTLVVLPLDARLHKKPPCVPPWGWLGFADWGGPPVSSSDSEDERDDEESEYELCLWPLVNGEAQCPQPVTTCYDHHMLCKPTIRLVYPLKVICNVKSCKLVIQLGDITKWSIDGKDDAVVNPHGTELYTEVDVFESGLKDPWTTGAFELPVGRIIHSIGPEDEGASFVASRYRKILALARREKIKYIAFPAISRSDGRFSADEEAIMSVGAVVEGSTKFNEVHFVLDDPEMFNVWVAATDSLNFAREELDVNKLKANAESADSSRAKGVTFQG